MGVLGRLKAVCVLGEVGRVRVEKEVSFPAHSTKKLLCFFFSIRRCKKSFYNGRGIFFVEYPMLNFSITAYCRVLLSWSELGRLCFEFSVL